MNHFDVGVFGACDLNGRARFDEASGYCGKIFHGRAEDGDFAECGGFQNVVTAGVYEGAADKDTVGEAVEGGEFADGVEEEDGDVVRNGVQAVGSARGNTGTGK